MTNILVLNGLEFVFKVLDLDCGLSSKDLDLNLVSKGLGLGSQDLVLRLGCLGLVYLCMTAECVCVC